MNTDCSKKYSAAFTLVETMVSMTIVGIATVGIVMPMLVESRKLSRRMTCQANLKSWADGVLALENAHQTFPSGGIHPWPNIDRYSDGQAAFPPERQGLGWMYQTLPFLIQDFGQPATTDGINKIESELFFCPARRGITRDGNAGTLLNDYVGMAAAPSRSSFIAQYGMAQGNMAFEQLLLNDRGCRSAYSFWGTTSFGNDFLPRSRQELGGFYTGFHGVFVRSSHYVRNNNGSVSELNYDQLTTARRIRDGLANTGMITEKSLGIASYGGGGPGDDRGWSDGWDLDTMRLTFCQPVSDQEAGSLSWPEFGLSPGSAHPGGLFVAYANGSVRFTNFDINLEAWNRIGNRADREIPIKFNGANPRN